MDERRQMFASAHPGQMRILDGRVAGLKIDARSVRKKSCFGNVSSVFPAGSVVILSGDRIADCELA